MTVYLPSIILFSLSYYKEKLLTSYIYSTTRYNDILAVPDCTQIIRPLLSPFPAENFTNWPPVPPLRPRRNPTPV